VQVDLGAVAAHGGDLDVRRGARHHDAATRAAAAAGERDALGVVAGGGGDDATRELRVTQVGDAVVGAAQLEGKDRGQVLAFDRHRHTEPLRQTGRVLEWRRRRQDFVDAGVERAFEHLIHEGLP
jgi:hypothetical protein